MGRIAQAFVMACLLTACSGDMTPDQPSTTETENASVPVAAKTSETEMERSEHLIVMLGDSLTAGYGLLDEHAVPYVTEQQLTARGHDISIVNAGVSGDTTAMGLARFDWSVRSVEPDLVIIALGANDFLGGFSAETAKQNLAQIIERAQAEKIDVILAGLQPRWPETSDTLEAEYAALYPELAAEYNVPFYPGFMNGVWNEPDLLLPDGLHPNRQGVEKMAEGLAGFLDGELDQP
ncbi:MAG: arylesterase [Ponticaulis sp.]|nr:arylesterase [Ponticaulis sp.]|tara:strand:+ start:16391 stop:17098 length:708 start_codon:yes stop_codon:yes gene_type:complete